MKEKDYIKLCVQCFKQKSITEDELLNYIENSRNRTNEKWCKIGVLIGLSISFITIWIKVGL